MVPADGRSPPVPLAKRRVVQDEAEDLLTLLQDLVAMSHEQQPLVASVRSLW